MATRENGARKRIKAEAYCRQRGWNPGLPHGLVLQHIVKPSAQLVLAQQAIGQNFAEGGPRSAGVCWTLLCRRVLQLHLCQVTVMVLSMVFCVTGT